MRKSLVIILIGVLVVVWLQTMFTILGRMSEPEEPKVHVSATMHYTGKNLSSDPSPVEMGRKKPLPQPQARREGMPTPAPSMKGNTATTGPFLHLDSKASVQVVGSGMQSPATGLTPTPSSTGRGEKKSLLTTSAPQVWIGMVSAVAAHDLAYVPAQSGELPDKSYLSGRRNAPPEEGGGGSNGPNIDVETPLSDGLAVLVICALLYIAAVDYRKFNNKQPKE